jgi:hypothetical protein
MKTKQIFIPLITIFIFSLTACKKDTITEPAPTPTATLSADSNYLSKLVIVDKQGAVIDTGFIRTYNYDNLKRVTTVIEYSKYLGIVQSYDSISYSYNSTDNLPFRIFEYFTEIGQTKDTATSFLTYNNSSQIIRDSSISSSKSISSNFYRIRTNISTFSYAPARIYGQVISSILFDNSNSETPYNQKDTATLDANNNITSCRQRTIIGTSSPSIETRISTFTYDNKPSPYLNQNVNTIFPNFPIGSDDLFNQQFSKNNRLKATVVTTGTFGGIYNEDFTGKYIYKLNGYPSSILIPDPTVSTDFIKFLFTYKTL